MQNAKSVYHPLLTSLLVVALVVLASPVMVNAQDITSGLAGHWKFDEGSGTTAADSSGNNNTGTLTNGPTWTAGKINGAMSFDGVDDYVKILNLSAQANMSYSLWINPTSFTGTYNTLIEFADDRPYFFLRNTGKVELYNNNPSSVTILQPNTWYHVVYTSDQASNTGKIYINGVAEPNIGTANNQVGTTLYIAWNTGDTPFKGIMDDVRVYNRALTASEVQTIYNIGSGTPPSDTTAPTVSITDPTSGSTVSGSSVPVSANASDNVGVAGVQFKLDGVNINAEDTTSPYSITWNSTTASNGSHTLTATARDAAGNQTTSSGVTVTVNNATSDTQAPSIPTGLTATAVSSNQINLSWTASTDNVGVTGYRVERCQGSSCTNFVQVATPSGTTFNDTGLSANTTYPYQVRATDAAGNLSGYSSTASATTQSAPTGGTALSNLAASMAPGTWATLTPGNIAAIDTEAGLATSYQDSAGWDAVNNRFLFLGSDHGVGYTFGIYNDSTNSWSNGPIISPPNIPFSTIYVGHAFDGNTTDPNGNFYYRIREGTVSGNHQIYKYSASTNTWTNLPDNPLTNEGGDCCQGIAYFPEMNGLIWVAAGSGKVFLFNNSTQQWSQIGNTGVSGSTWNFVEYNPLRQVVIFGSGVTGRLYKISSLGAVTALNNIPVSIYNGSGFIGQVTTDPVSGKFIVLTAGSRNCHTYEVTTDTWTTCTNPPSALQNSALASAPVSDYGVIAFLSCGSTSGQCDGKLYLYKHTAGSPPPSDTQAPSVPTGLSVTTVSSSQLNLSWTASTDNVGVTGYRIERCQGLFCTNFVQIATPSTNSYSDTGLSANTTYRYQVRATDATGNLSGYSSIGSETTQSNGGTSADADFQARCGAGGVILCTGFDAASDIIQNVALFPAGNNQFFGSLDATQKASGASALKFRLPAGSSSGNISGFWRSPQWSQTFSQNSHFYVQYRTRLSPEMLTNLSQWDSEWKNSILHMGGISCGGVEITIKVRSQGIKIPEAYTGCGSPGFYLDDGTNIWLEQGANPKPTGAGYWCAYPNGPDCFFFPSNTWITIYWDIQIGTWGSANSSIKGYVATNGGAYEQVWNLSNFTLDRNSQNSDGYNEIDFLPYMTALSTSANIDANVWYDELVVSTQPIAVPGGSTPPSTLVGDLNNDRTVNGFDWTIMEGQWFTNNPQSDLNSDGIVNSIDFSLMNANWGRSV